MKRNIRMLKLMINCIKRKLYFRIQSIIDLLFASMTLKLSPEQLQQFKQAFKVLDADGDGKITPQQLRSIMKQFGYSTTEQEIHLIIQNIDTDRNGTIQLQQFLSFIAKQATNTQPRDQSEDLKQVFKLFDKDGNGFISKDELCLGLKQLGQNMSEKDVVQLLQAADLDGDGNISFDEFVELMKFK